VATRELQQMDNIYIFPVCFDHWSLEEYVGARFTCFQKYGIDLIVLANKQPKGKEKKTLICKPLDPFWMSGSRRLCNADLSFVPR